jgi:hypothetical protein
MLPGTALRALIAASVVFGNGAGLAQQASTETSSAVGPEPTDEELMARGLAFRKLGQDSDALAAFEHAYAQHPSPRAAAQVALARQALAHWREAERGLLEALHAKDDPWITRYRAELDQSLAAVQAHLASLEVECNVDGAEVWVQRELQGHTPLGRPMRVDAGDVSVELRAPNATIQRVLHIDAGSQVHATFTFVASPLGPSPPLTTPPSADVPSASPERGRASGDTGGAPFPAGHSPTGSQAKTGGYIALAAAGGLALVGIAGLSTREVEASIYNDDARCAPIVVGNMVLSRYNRCGTNRDIGSAALTIGVASLVGAGVAGILSAVLLAQPSALFATRKTAAGCAVTVAGFACHGLF